MACWVGNPHHPHGSRLRDANGGMDCVICLWSYLVMVSHVYDKKSDEGSNSVRMRPENSSALKVVKN